MTQPIDRIKVNDTLTSTLAGLGWTAETDVDDERLNDLTHHVADLIEGQVAQFLADVDADTEPPEGSVVMAHGPTGTAYQRLHSDGLWHAPTSEQARTWEEVYALSIHPLIIIYRAPQEA